MTTRSDQILPMFMDCIVVGGKADGLFLRRIRANAQYIKLGAPVGIKPLASSKQEHVEIEREEDVYEVHPLSLQNTHEKDIQHVVGIAVVEGQTLTWAYRQLLTTYVQVAAQKLRDAHMTAIAH